LPIITAAEIAGDRFSKRKLALNDIIKVIEIE